MKNLKKLASIGIASVLMLGMVACQSGNKTNANKAQENAVEAQENADKNQAEANASQAEANKAKNDAQEAAQEEATNNASTEKAE